MVFVLFQLLSAGVIRAAEFWGPLCVSALQLYDVLLISLLGRLKFDLASLWYTECFSAWDTVLFK